MQPIDLFYSYAHEDERYRDELARHLALLRRRGLVREWHDRKIPAGSDWEGAISREMEEAEVVLFLVSADFIASDYCWSVEVEQALRREERGECSVIPVIIRPVDGWETAPFGRLQALPKDAKPVATWSDRDEAWTDVARGIRGVVETLSAERGRGAAALAEAPLPAAAAGDDQRFIAAAMNRFGECVDVALRTRGMDAGAEAVRASAEALAELTAPRRVLWVDDNPRNNATETAALFALQVEVDTALTTEEAMRRLRDGGYDLVITDWHRDPQLRPGTAEGVRLLEEMRAAGIRVPAIVYHGASGGARAAERERAARALGAIGATAHPAELMRWAAAALREGAAPSEG